MKKNWQLGERHKFARSSCHGFVAQWLERPTGNRKTQVRSPAGLRCVFSSDPAVSLHLSDRKKKGVWLDGMVSTGTSFRYKHHKCPGPRGPIFVQLWDRPNHRKLGGHFALFKHGHLLGRDVHMCINPDSPVQGLEIAEVKSPACFSISGDEFAAGITSLLPGVNNLRLWNGLEYDRAYLVYYVWLPKKWHKISRTLQWFCNWKFHGRGRSSGKYMPIYAWEVIPADHEHRACLKVSGYEVIGRARGGLGAN